MCLKDSGMGGVTKKTVRRRLVTGPVVDLAFGFELASENQRKTWLSHVRKEEPKVVIMGPLCTDFGACVRLNCEYPGFAEAYAVCGKIGESLHRR